MNRINALLLVVALLVAGMAANLVMTGCRTANQATFRTVSTERLTVQEMMKLFNQWVKEQTAAGKSTVDQERQAKAIYEKWQVAQMMVCDAGAVYAASFQTNSAGSTGFSAALQNAIANADQLRTDLSTLLASFGVKVPGL